MSSTHSRNGRAKRATATSSSRGGASRTSSRPGALAELIEHETPANGNIFEDLGFPPDEAAHLLLQVELAFLIKDRVKKKRLTQARAAKLFGVSQQRINDLLRGKLDRFSIDMLIMMLARAGIKVGLTIEPMAAGGEPALRG